MKKLLVLMMALAMSLSLASCGGDNAETPASTLESTTSATQRQDNVTPKQAAAIVDIMAKMGPLYNEAVEAATMNGWDTDETAMQELNMVYTIMDSARVGLGELDGYGDTSTEDIDTIVAQYQTMLDEMPNLIAKFSEPYSK
ncbi:MAG: acid shock protein [Eubacteriales bacterium]